MLDAITPALKPVLLALALPPTPGLFCIALGVTLAMRQHRTGWALFGAGLIAVWLSSTEAGADRLRDLLLPAIEVLTPERADALRGAEATAILVLGGGALQDSPEYGGATLKPLSLERLRYGAWLARRTGLPLAYTGGIGWGNQPGAIAEGPLAVQVIDREYGMTLLFAESASRDTRENASFSLPLLQEKGIRQLVLVTHDPHMPRALRAFREAAGTSALSIIAAPVGASASSSPTTLYDWLPSAQGYARSRYALYEWLGLRLGH